MMKDQNARACYELRSLLPLGGTPPGGTLLQVI